MKKTILCITTIFIMIAIIFGAGCITEKVDYDVEAQKTYEQTLELIENTPSASRLVEGNAHVIEAIDRDISEGTKIIMIDVLFPDNEYYCYSYGLVGAHMLPIKDGVKICNDDYDTLYIIKKEGVAYNYMYLLLDAETGQPIIGVAELIPEYYNLITGLAATFINQQN